MLPSRACPAVLCLLLGLALPACSTGAPTGEAAPVAVVEGTGDDELDTADAPVTDAPAPPGPPQAAEPEPSVAEEATAHAAVRPAWLGTRVLALRPDGFGEMPPTPPELDDRRLPPPPGLPPPAGEAFAATVAPVPADVAARSTWSQDCPVSLDELAYLTVTFWGFDERPHTGELLVNAGAAEALTGVFRHLYEARFPIEEMRVVAPAELDAPPTGDGNNTTGFVCRSTVESGSWSQHAFGLAVDINPFHNPYARGDVVLPELASSYVDRARHRPGMIQPGDAVTDAFAAIGWPWGGNWRSAKDWMHFSANGR